MLDEPTAGVDIEMRHSLYDLLKELNQSGTTIILTTHYLEEAEKLCDRIAIIDNGQLIADEPKVSLLERYSTGNIVEVQFENEPESNYLELFKSYNPRMDENAKLYLSVGKKDLMDMLQKLIQLKTDFSNMVIEQPQAGRYLS